MLGRFAALLIRGYQYSIGKYVPSRCRFYPSCSEYAVQALRQNGLLFGGLQSIWRLLRCGPWTTGGFDPVHEHRHLFGRRVNAGG